MSREYPQMKLRLPRDLRDRIKAYAERQGRSMNTEIVRVLEREYPPARTLEDRIYDALQIVRLMEKMPLENQFDTLTEELVQTIRLIASGKIGEFDEDGRSAVSSLLYDWDERRSEEEIELFLSDHDEEEVAAIQRGERPEKR